MRKLTPTAGATLALVLLAAATTHAAERIRTAVLPVKVVPKKLPKAFHPGEYVQKETIIGMKLRPCKPNRCMNLSITKAARAI